MNNEIFDIARFDSRLEELRLGRFTEESSKLYDLVKQLFQPLEGLYALRIGNSLQPLDMTPVTVGWAWNNYYKATTQAEVDLVISSWVPTLLIVKNF